MRENKLNVKLSRECSDIAASMISVLERRTFAGLPLVGVIGRLVARACWLRSGI